VFWIQERISGVCRVHLVMPVAGLDYSTGEQRLFI